MPAPKHLVLLAILLLVLLIPLGCSSPSQSGAGDDPAQHALKDHGGGGGGAM